MAEHCACCGVDIPEGRQVCPVCDTQELKPCRCGGRGHVVETVEWDGRTEYAVLCGRCGEWGPDYDTRAAAVRAWNEGKDVI